MQFGGATYPASIVVYIQITFKSAGVGHLHATFTRLPCTPRSGGHCTIECVLARQLGETVNRGVGSEIPALVAFLIWPHRLDERTRNKVVRKLPQYLKALIAEDEELAKAMRKHLNEGISDLLKLPLHGFKPKV